MNWEKSTIGEHCEITSSKRIFYSEYVESGVPFYRSKEIIEKYQGQAISEPLFISRQKYIEIKNKFGVPQSGDLLLTSVGTIGIPYIVKYEDEFYFKDGNLTWFRNFDDKLFAKYLYYWILSTMGKGILLNSVIGSSQKALTITALKTISLSLPPIETQKRIADILSAYDDLIENNQKQIKLLEETAQRLYKEWFIDLRFPGHETTPIINGIPEGWTTNALFDLFLTARGVSYSSADLGKPNDGALLVNLKNIKAWGGYNRGAEKSYAGSYRKSQILCAGDIIMAVTDMTQERRVVGHVAIVPTLNKDTTFSMDIIKVIPKPNYTTKFLYAILRYSGIAEEISKHANGTNVLHLRPNCFDTISVIIPPQSIRKHFEDLISDTYLLIDKLEIQIFLAKEARDRLLPKLMSGEIEV